MHQFTDGIVLSAVSFQFSNTSFHFGDTCLYVGNSGPHSRDSGSYILEYICTFTNAHKQLVGHWYRAHILTKATKPSIHIRDHSVVSSSTGDEPSGEMFVNQLTTV